MDLTPITLPPGWDAEKDCAYFLERWEPEPTYTEALWGWMRFHRGELVRVLGTALCYFRGHDANLVDTDLGCLTPAEKIALLQAIAAKSPRVAAWRARLVDNLAACAFAEAERARVVADYCRAGEHGWMYPVTEAIDYVGAASFELEETLVCETKDYRAFAAGLDSDE